MGAFCVPEGRICRAHSCGRRRLQLGQDRHAIDEVVGRLNDPLPGNWAGRPFLSPKVKQPAAKLSRPEASRGPWRRASIIAPLPLKAGASRFTPQRAFTKPASRLTWSSVPRSGQDICVRPHLGQRKPVASAGSDRWPRGAEAHAAPDWPGSRARPPPPHCPRRPSRMSVSAIRSVDRTPHVS